MAFAVMDDSMVYRDGLYVYSHALVIADEIPQVAVFAGTKHEVYSNENNIVDFLNKHLNGEELYACEHYRQYSRVWEMVSQIANDKKLPKRIRQHFVQAHHAAKKTAKITLEELALSWS